MPTERQRVETTIRRSKALRRPLLFLIVTIASVLVIVYMATMPSLLAEITVLPLSEPYAQVLSRQVTCSVSRTGEVFFDFQAAVSDKFVRRVHLEVRPERVAQWFAQGDGFAVDRGLAAGTVQLGSGEYRVSDDASYKFRLLDESRRQLVEGRILMEVHTLASGPRWLIIALGLLASGLQIVSFLLEHLRNPPGTEPPT